MLLAIDPGCDTGWALFDSARRLQACGLGDPRDEHQGPTHQVIIECPARVYRGIPTGAILKLAAKAGEWFGRYEATSEVAYVAPDEWIGGSVDKRINHPRIWAKLVEAERSIVDRAFRAYPGRTRSLSGAMAAARIHNIVDAIGIGLHGVGR